MAEEPPQKKTKNLTAEQTKKKKKKSPLCCFTANRFYVVNLKNLSPRNRRTKKSPKEKKGISLKLWFTAKKTSKSNLKNC